MNKLFLGFLICMMIPPMMQAQFNWLYQYNGVWNGEDHAWSIACGLGGTVYVAGTSHGAFRAAEMVVLSLASGDTNWIYRYNQIPDSNDNNQAYAICYGDDGNVYVGGLTGWDLSDLAFTVISLADSGLENWVYRDTSAGYGSCANAIIFADSTIFAAGTYRNNFAVVSFQPSGDTNWVCQDVPGDVYAIDFGVDHNIYAAGQGDGYKALVASLTVTGDTNWIRSYQRTPGWFMDVASGLDGNIYAAGYYWEYMETSNFIVMSLAPSGDTNWTYEFDGNNNYPYDYDDAGSLVFGADSNLYVVGTTMQSAGSGCLIVISLDRAGNERWIRTYPGGMIIKGDQIAYGSDNFIYVSGYSEEGYFQILRLDTLGNVDWAYRNNGSGDGMDIATAIDLGDDGNIYAAGRIRDSISDYDILVVSIGPEGKVNESRGSRQARSIGRLHIWPNPFSSRMVIEIPVALDHNFQCMSLYDVTGRKRDVVWESGRTMPARIEYQPPLDLEPGIYFIAINGKISGKVIKVR